MALYAQDQWTVRRLTFNPGLRYDYLHAWDPAQRRPEGPFVPAFDFAKVTWCSPPEIVSRLGSPTTRLRRSRVVVSWWLPRWKSM